MRNLFQHVSPGSGDWAAGTYLFFSQLAVMVVCVSPLLAAGFPPAIITVSVLPAFAWQHIVGHGYCAISALRLARREKRRSVTALPGLGVDLVGGLAVTLGVMMPTWLDTGDPYLTWGLGLGANLLFGLTKLFFCPLAAWLKRVVPRAALLGLLGGLLLVYVGTTYGITAMEQPYLAFFAIGVMTASMFGQWLDRVPLIPVVIVLGPVIGYASGHWSLPAGALEISPALGQFTSAGLSHLGTAVSRYSPLIIPLALGNQLLRSLSNIEAAEVVGDAYDPRALLFVDGLVTTVGGAFVGSWMPTFLLAGQPGWKESGARIMYPGIAAVAYALTGFTGILWFLQESIPEGVIAGIFIWLALSVTNAAIKGAPPNHTPALLFSFIPVAAHLVVSQAVDGADAHSLRALAAGFPFTAVVWAAVVVYLIERDPYRSAGWCLVGALLSLLGLMHSSMLGVHATSLPIVAGYAIWGSTILLVYAINTMLEGTRRSR